MTATLTMGDLSKETGVPTSTLKLWVAKGHLRPAVTSYGAGDRNLFTEDAIAQVHAILRIREWFGDGTAARRVIEQAIPQVKSGTPRIRVPEFELPLTR